MSTDQVTGAQIWMRDDGKLVVSVPYLSVQNEEQQITRHRLHEAILKRWPDGNSEMLVAFANATMDQPLEMMEDTEHGVQCGVVLR